MAKYGYILSSRIATERLKKANYANGPSSSVILIGNSKLEKIKRLIFFKHVKGDV